MKKLFFIVLVFFTICSITAEDFTSFLQNNSGLRAQLLGKKSDLQKKYPQLFNKVVPGIVPKMQLPVVEEPKSEQTTDEKIKAQQIQKDLDDYYMDLSDSISRAYSFTVQTSTVMSLVESEAFINKETNLMNIEEIRNIASQVSNVLMVIGGVVSIYPLFDTSLSADVKESLKIGGISIGGICKAGIDFFADRQKIANIAVATQAFNDVKIRLEKYSKILDLSTEIEVKLKKSGDSILALPAHNRNAKNVSEIIKNENANIYDASKKLLALKALYDSVYVDLYNQVEQYSNIAFKMKVPDEKNIYLILLNGLKEKKKKYDNPVFQDMFTILDDALNT